MLKVLSGKFIVLATAKTISLEYSSPGLLKRMYDFLTLRSQLIEFVHKVHTVNPSRIGH